MWIRSQELWQTNVIKQKASKRTVWLLLLLVLLYLFFCVTRESVEWLSISDRILKIKTSENPQAQYAQRFDKYTLCVCEMFSFHFGTARMITLSVRWTNWIAGCVCHIFFFVSSILAFFRFAFSQWYKFPLIQSSMRCSYVVVWKQIHTYTNTKETKTNCRLRDTSSIYFMWKWRLNSTHCRFGNAKCTVVPSNVFPPPIRATFLSFSIDNTMVNENEENAIAKNEIIKCNNENKNEKIFSCAFGNRTFSKYIEIRCRTCRKIKTKLNTYWLELLFFIASKGRQKKGIPKGKWEKTKK